MRSFSSQVTSQHPKPTKLQSHKLTSPERSWRAGSGDFHTTRPLLQYSLHLNEAAIRRPEASRAQTKPQSRMSQLWRVKVRILAGGTRQAVALDLPSLSFWCFKVERFCVLRFRFCFRVWVGWFRVKSFRVQSLGYTMLMHRYAQD